MVAGVLHVQITLSHFAMEIITPPPEQSTTDPSEVVTFEPFPAHQLRTSLDIDCPEWLDWWGED